jgi:hypothetical protein
LDESSSRLNFLIARDFFRKTASTFPDHALAPFNRPPCMRIDAASDAMALLSLTNAGHVVATRRLSASSYPRRKRESFDFGNAEFAPSTS